MMEATNAIAIIEAPHAFSGIVGQDLTVSVLRSRLCLNEKLDCHLTFAGPSGAGKRVVALLYAQSLVCDARLADGSPCRACDECLAIQRGSSFAYVEIDAARQGDDETIRTLLERDALLNTARVRVVVINNAERMTMSGADAALKTLERETKSVFLFLVNDLRAFAGALRSRCHVFHVGPVDEASLEAHLVHICDRNGIAYERPALRIVVQESRRLTGRAVAMLLNVATRGGVSVANARAFLDLGWEADILCCWQSLLADKFDESFGAFQRIAFGNPNRIRAMQAFLFELVVRDEVEARTVSTHPGLDRITDEAWTEMTRNWNEFASHSSTNGKAMRREALAWWREVQLDAPSAIVFRRAYEWLHIARVKAPRHCTCATR